MRLGIFLSVKSTWMLHLYFFQSDGFQCDTWHIYINMMFFSYDLAYSFNVMNLVMNLTYFYRCDARPGIFLSAW